MRTPATLVAIIILISAFSYSRAQNVLPKFSAVTKGNGKVIISWTNHYRAVSQISIQRSKDSLKGFATIITVPDPTATQNGFVDAKAPDARHFYRLFVVLDSGKFVFTGSQRAFWDTIRVPVNKPVENAKRVVIAESVSPKQAEEIKEKLQTATTTVPTPTPVPEPEKFFIIKKHDSIISQIPAKEFKKFRDSVVTKTKDTIAFSSIDTIVLKPFVPKEVYKPSKYVYTARDGNVTISLPDAPRHRYAIKFFEEDNTPLFDIGEVKESPLLIDKANFLHAGWFRFELYEDGKLKERHRLYIPKDF